MDRDRNSSHSLILLAQKRLLAILMKPQQHVTFKAQASEPEDVLEIKERAEW